MKPSTIRYLVFLLIAIGLIVGGFLSAKAQAINPNIPANVEWKGYSGNPTDKTFPLLSGDVGKTIVVEARSAKLPGARLLSPQPVILSRTADSLYVRYPAVNVLLNGWIEVKVDGIVRFSGTLTIDKTNRTSKVPVAVSYVLLQGTGGGGVSKFGDLLEIPPFLSSSNINGLTSSVTALQTGKVDNATYSAFLGAQQTIDNTQNTNTANALSIAQGAATSASANAAQIAADTAYFNAQQDLFQSATTGAYDAAVAADTKAQSALTGLAAKADASALEPGVLQFNTYALAVAGLIGRTKPARVLILADEVNNGGGFGKYDYTGTILIEDLL